MSTFELGRRLIWVAGHRGMAGSAIVRRFVREDCEVMTATRSEVGLLRQADVEAWMAVMKTDVVFHAAATGGGILANSTRAAEFLYENLVIATNVIHCAKLAGVKSRSFWDRPASILVRPRNQCAKKIC